MDLIERIQIANTQQPHCATVLLLDTSHSMSENNRIDQLQAGLNQFKREVCEDELARKRVDIAAVTFGETVDVAQPFTPIEQFVPCQLAPRGRTPMGAAIRSAIELIEERKNHYKTLGVDYYRPWIFLLTDGEPTDMRVGSALWQETINKIHGVGPFGVESWHVFCRDEGATIKLSKGGEPLAPFVAWRKRAAQAEAKAGK